MIKQSTFRVIPSIAYNEKALREYICREFAIPYGKLSAIRIRRRSIDARQRTIFVNLSVDIYIDEYPPRLDYLPIDYPSVENCPTVVVVGAGPGGLFAALRLIELGLRPIVLERGKDVHNRRKDIAKISREHLVDSESNYSFGEGGAGAFSDGKLYTRSKKRGNVEKILRVFCQHGASTDILCDAHPHIGTDRLPRIIEAMRNQIIEAGGEVHFNSRVDELIIKDKEIIGTRTADCREFHGPVILATGHSARDVYKYLYQQGIHIEAKGIAVGVRLEHPSALIDQIQYHNREGRGKWLPAAEYNFVAQVENRGVYSFCMCPGGTVVPAATDSAQVVVNGMSASHRSGAWSNSGMVVETRVEDLDGELRPFMQEALQDEDFAAQYQGMTKSEHPLCMMAFQAALERATWIQGGRRQVAPAQRMADFVNRRLSADLPASSYSAGLIASPLHFWMPRFVVTRLAEGFKKFGKSSRGFLTNDALMIAAETRTSAPVRITRDPATLCHTHYAGFYPCGEGAGYAGGIVSAAIDGERCAEAVAEHLLSNQS